MNTDFLMLVISFMGLMFAMSIDHDFWRPVLTFANGAFVVWWILCLTGAVG